MLVVIEGVDGVGKTTICKELQKRILRENIPMEIIHGGVNMEIVPPYLADAVALAKRESLPDAADVMKRLAFASARALNRDRLRGYALNPNRTAVLDRYVETNAAYAYAVGGTTTAQFIRDYEYRILELPRPDLTIVLTASIELIRYRIEARNSDGYDSSPATRFELDGTRLNSMNYYYTQVLPILSSVHIEHVERSGSLRSVEELTDSIYSRIEGLS